MRASILLSFVLVLSACAGSRPEPEDPPETVSFPEEQASTYEPAPVYEPAPAPTPVYEAPAPAPARQVNGFRVQVYASESNAGGEQKRAEAQQWWTAEQRRTGFQAPLDAYVVYIDGLYKVRMGAFTNRQDAEAALALVRTHFPDAFLTPDLVTVDG